jgi:hypothetical protein
VREVDLLGVDDSVEWTIDGERLVVAQPGRLPVSPAHVVRIRPVPAAR